MRNPPARTGFPLLIYPSPRTGAGTLRDRSERMKMAKKPNYDFERRERHRLQAEKKAKRAAAKKEAREAKSAQSDQPDTETVNPPFPDR